MIPLFWKLGRHPAFQFPREFVPGQAVLKPGDGCDQAVAPHPNLVIENRAIGGFASQLLVKTAETDLYSFYPDLMIFHVYGSHIEYENIIRRIRERTTAEILMQTDHLAAGDSLDEEMDPEKLSPQQWTPWMNHAEFLPDVAKRYGAELVDQRDLWKRYLRDESLPPSALLRDGVHLNDRGCKVMAEIVGSYFRYDPELGDPSPEGLAFLIS